MDLLTLCAQGGPRRGEQGGPLAPPIVSTSAFRFGDLDEIERYYRLGEGFLYSRYENPTVRRAEELIAALEGAPAAAAFASGMAAISTTLLALADSGARVAAQRELYGGTVALLDEVLPAAGIDVVRLDRETLAALSPDRLEGCRLLYVETPINPTLRLIDLRHAADAARAAGVPLVVDSTFATPALQRPLELGASLVVHSATKYLGGHSDLLGGVVSGEPDLVERIVRRRRLLGAVLDPFSAFLLHRGLRTLGLRMEAHCRGAEAVARALERHPRVERVDYPGLERHPDHLLAGRQMRAPGGMVSLVVGGGERAARAVHDRLRLFQRAATLGGVESLVLMPSRTSHRELDPDRLARAGIPAGLLRLSIGLEAPADLIADLDQALAGAPGA